MKRSKMWALGLLIVLLAGTLSYVIATGGEDTESHVHVVTEEITAVMLEDQVVPMVSHYEAELTAILHEGNARDEDGRDADLVHIHIGYGGEEYPGALINEVIVPGDTVQLRLTLKNTLSTAYEAVGLQFHSGELTGLKRVTCPACGELGLAEEVLLAMGYDEWLDLHLDYFGASGVDELTDAQLDLMLGGYDHENDEVWPTLGPEADEQVVALAREHLLRQTRFTLGGGADYTWAELEGADSGLTAELLARITDPNDMLLQMEHEFMGSYIGNAYQGAAIQFGLTLTLGGSVDPGPTEEVTPSPSPGMGDHTVTYHMNDGSGRIYLTQTVADGGRANAPAAPARSGYTFEGWSLGEDGDLYDFSAPVTADIHLYAVWSPDLGLVDDDHHTVTYYMNDGSGAIYLMQTVADGETATRPADPEREGYGFTGWSLDMAGTGDDFRAYDFGTPVTEDLGLYAVWTPDADSIDRDNHYAYLQGYEDGTIGPDQHITRAEVATIFFRLLTDEAREENWRQTNSFSDVSADDWYNNAVSTMANMGFLNGYPEGTFGPNSYITRGELAAIVARFSGETYDGPNRFTDIGGHWAVDEINIAASIGWIEGDGDGTYRPDDDITRAEVAALVNRFTGRALTGAGDMLEDMRTWPDNPVDGDWYYLDIQEATNSHYHQWREDGGETWTALRENPDWTLLERPDSTPKAIIVE